jgi:hypothetical protein
MVTISPTSATVAAGKSRQFSAVVTGTSQTAVNWSASAGSISGDGLFTAPTTSVAINATVTVTSAADHDTTATASVAVTASELPTPLTIQTSSLATAIVGAAYTADLSASGGHPPYRWSLDTGVLPSGIQLNDATGTISGTAVAPGQFSFNVGLADSDSDTAQRTLSLSVADASACESPIYACARTDTEVIPLPATLPSWGGLLGANTVFTDPSFDATHPPVYVRVTDANTYLSCNPVLTDGGFSVTTGSGDEAIFNADDSLFLFVDGGSNPCIFGLNASTMNTGFIYQGVGNLSTSVEWSQSNPQDLYDLSGLNGGLYLAQMLDSGSATCRLGGPACSPIFTQLYNFVSNCNVNPSYEFYELAGVGGNDNVFGATFAAGGQDTGHEVVAYNRSSNTCYFYNTQSGTVRSYTATPASASGTVSCDGTTTVTYDSGTAFDATWAGLNITIAGTHYVIESVSGRAITLYSACPAQSHASYSTNPGTLLGAITSADRYTVHNVKIDPSGTWMIVVEGNDCYSVTCQVVHAWQVGTTTVNNCLYEAGGGDSGYCDAHWTESASGWFNGDSFSGNSPSMLFRNWANFNTADTANLTELNTFNATLFSPFDGHPSNKNDPLGTHSYPILASTYAPETPAGTISMPYSNEILGWSQTPGPVLRFGHTFNSALENSTAQFPGEIAVGAPSSTGQFYIFTTDGEGTLGSVTGGPSCSVTGGTCRYDVFILNLAASPQ